MFGSLPAPAKSVTLLAASNVFMTFAWYGHLKYLEQRPWVIAALISWGIALFEYLLQVPGNRIGYENGMSLAQLKITQLFFMKQPLRLDFLWAGLCMVGAVYFVFRSS